MMVLPVFTPRNWYWFVAGDETRAWSSAQSAYVPAAQVPQGQTVTRIASEADLTDVLATYGLAPPVCQVADYQAAIQAHVDGVAQAKGYDSGTSISGYVNSTVPAWSAEAQAFIAWRDAVWVYAYQELAKVQEGQRPQPSVYDLIAELPAIAW